MKEKLIAMLKAAGVENAEAIAEAMLKDERGKILIDDGKDNVFVPKSRLDSEIAKKKASDDLLKNAQETIKGLEKEVGESQTALQEIEKYKKEAERLQTEMVAKEQNQALKEAILSFDKKAHDVDAIIPFLDQASMVFKEGKIHGLTEQLKSLSESKTFLFQQESQGGTGNPGNPGAGAGVGGARKKSTETESIGEQLGKQAKAIQAAPEKSFFE